MKKVSYESLKADQAWIAVTHHLQRRNLLLADCINYLETHPTDHALAGRLVVLQYHLRATIRRLVNETANYKATTNSRQQVKRQWMVVHQLHLLLRQIDDEFRKTGTKSSAFRRWINCRETTIIPFKATPAMFLN